MIIYLIHFDKPYKHARHYLGITGNLPERLEAHRSGNGNPLMREVCKAGIPWSVVRIWTDSDRATERRLKKQHKTRMLCPVCNPDGWMNREKSQDIVILL